MLTQRKTGQVTTIVRVGNARIGGAQPAVMAGPCAVESREQLLAAARLVKAGGAQMLRGGAFKPRTSPYSFLCFFTTDCAVAETKKYCCLMRRILPSVVSSAG